jgi:hypothetical protein
MSSKSHT